MERPARPALRAPFLLPGLGLLVLAILPFIDVLAASSTTVLSAADHDLQTQFLPWREFGFREMRGGNLPLWNPHVFSGSPFFGGFQSALLYPPNLLFLVLPIGWAFNLGFVLHLFLAGLFMYLWCRERGLSRLPAFLGGTLLMFSGPVVTHVYPGHVSNVCAMAWVPLLFLVLDRLAEAPSAKWTLLGAGATGLLLLAGHPQYVFHAAVAATLYCAWLLAAAPWSRRLPLALHLLGVAGGGLLLAAAPIGVGLQETAHTVRAGGISYEYASIFSFPPENILTLLAPDLFGGMDFQTYWGRGLYWEMCLYIGVVGFWLALHGGVSGPLRDRGPLVAMAAILFILALGAHTPLFRFLYEVVPGFSSFRGHSKFVYPLILFVVMLAARGGQDLLDGVMPGKRARQILAGTGALLIAAALLAGVACGARSRSWRELLKGIHERAAASFDTGLPAEKLDEAEFLDEAARRAGFSLGRAGVLSLLVWAVLWLPGLGGPSRRVGVLAILAVLEVGIHARTSAARFELDDARYPRLEAAAPRSPGGPRMLFIDRGNVASSMGAYDIWGFDPATPRRYAQFLHYTQRQDPRDPSQYLTVARGHPRLALLRHTTVFKPPEGELLWKSPSPPLPRFFFVRRLTVAGDRWAALAEVDKPEFDPMTRVILEEKPAVLPRGAGGSGGRDEVLVLDESTDHVTLRVELPSAAVLVMTDAYHPFWRAVPLEGSIQDEYDVMPANFVNRAIPMKQGRHHLRIEYHPPGFHFLMILMTLSWLSWVGLLAWVLRGRAAPSGPHPSAGGAPKRSQRKRKRR